MEFILKAEYCVVLLSHCNILTNQCSAVFTRHILVSVRIAWNLFLMINMRNETETSCLE